MFRRSFLFKLLVGELVIYSICLILLRQSLPFAQQFAILTFIVTIIAIPTTVIIAGIKYAPKPFNNFMTWFSFILFVICILNAIGQDDKNLLITLFGADVLYRQLLHLPYIATVEVNITLIGYITRVGLGVFYGGLVDLFLRLRKKDRT